MPTAAVIGGGINGIMTAWALAEGGINTTLYEATTLMSCTSRASTKLLHGGLRYLENGEFRLVYESLHERQWWLKNAPHLAHPIEIFLPVYRGASRSRLVLRVGLLLYDLLSGRANLGRARWHSKAAAALRFGGQELRTEGLSGAFSFYDAQMDDYALGIWAAEQARAAGVTIKEHCRVNMVNEDGALAFTEGNMTDQQATYDRIVNCAGPWAGELLKSSSIASDQEIDWVRGSHIVIDRPMAAGIMMQVPNERRIVFALPYQGRTLIGTTEVRQAVSDDIQTSTIACSPEEERYLLDVYNFYFDSKIGPEDVAERFAGVRPLLHSTGNATKASREYDLERRGRLITVFGGKWTTARVLGKKAAQLAAEGIS